MLNRLWLGLSIAFLNPLPTKIDVQGTTLSDRSNKNDSLNTDIDIFSYRHSDNTKVLIIASVNDLDVTITDFKSAPY